MTFSDVVAIIITDILIVADVAAALAIAFRRLKGKCRTSCRLEIQNLGNTPCRYQLRATDPAGALALRFAADGVNLQQQAIQVTEEVVESEKAEKRRGRRTGKQRSGGRRRSGEAAGMGKVRQAASGGLGLGRAIADILGAAAVLLPRSMGAPLKSLSGKLRRQQAAVSRVERAPRQTAGRVKSLSRKVTKIKPAASSARVEEPAEVPTPPQPAPATVTRTVVEMWAKTPIVEPGESLVVDLLVAPVKLPFQTQRHPLTVTSKLIEREDIAPVVEEGTIQIEGAPWLRESLLGLFILAVLIGAEFLCLGLFLAITGKLW